MTVESGRLAPEAVRSMFDRISPVYDAMNRTMTMGLDQRWRRATVAAVVRPGDRVLDACCGTGDLAVAALRAGATVTGLDFSERMLERALRKSAEIEWVQGDAEQLPFEDASFDAAVCSLVLCSVPDQAATVAELRRVLRPAGELRFFEHVRSSSARVARVQAAMDRSGLWPRLVGGCHCARDTPAAIAAGGFAIERERDFMVGPKWGITSPHALGRARSA